MKNNGNLPATTSSLVMGTCSAAAASDANAYVGSDTAGFCGKVDLTIASGAAASKCVYPVSAVAACPATPTIAGNLGAVGGTTFNQASTVPVVALAAGSTNTYTFTVMLDTTATNIDQGLTASQTMTWNQA